MFAVIYIPDFALQSLLRIEPELFLKPVALIDGEEKKRTVFQLTKSARDAGVAQGLTATQALARCGEICIKARSPADEKITAQILLQVAYTFSPRIENTADGVCTIDLQGLPLVTNLSALPAGQKEKAAETWAEDILRILSQLHLQAQVGIASTPSIAFHAAREAKPALFIENPGEFISALPIESLEPTPPIYDILQRWGIRKVGEFTALGKDKIAERLGEDALELFDRASATESRPLDLIVPPEEFSEAMDLEGEIESLDPLLFILRRFVEQLSGRISALHLVVSELRLQLKLASGDKYGIVLKVPAPTAEVETLFRMLQTHLETVRTDSAIIALALSARPARAENFQFGLFEASLRDPNQFAETLARLAALCGHDRVGSAIVANTYRPDAFTMGSPNFERTELPRIQPPTFLEAAVQGLSLRRFRPPFHADVEMHSGRPTFLSSLKVSSPIRKVSGPFRSSGEWWEEQKVWNRDEWDVETADGSLFRLYHANNDWFIEGSYD